MSSSDQMALVQEETLGMIVTEGRSASKHHRGSRVGQHTHREAGVQGGSPRAPSEATLTAGVGGAPCPAPATLRGSNPGTAAGDIRWQLGKPSGSDSVTCSVAL